MLVALLFTEPVNVHPPSGKPARLPELSHTITVVGAVPYNPHTPRCYRVIYDVNGRILVTASVPQPPGRQSEPPDVVPIRGDRYAATRVA